MMLVMIAIITYFVIGLVLVAAAVWVDGEITLEYAPAALALVPGWPLLVVYMCATQIGPWWKANKDRVLWSRK